MEVDPSDRTHYLVDVIYPTESRCYFTLKACAIPRFPFAEMTYTHTPKDCQNYVTFNNTSCIVTDEGRSDDKVDAVYWNFGNGQTSMELNPVLAVPNEGYHYDSCYLVASLCGDLCTDTLWFELDVPAIGHVSSSYETFKCQGDTVFVEGDTIVEPGSYLYLYQSKFSGCDSSVVVVVGDYPVYDIEVNDTIIMGEEYLFGSQTLTKSGDYEELFKSVHDCDSNVTLHLCVLQLLEFETADYIEVCHDDDIIPIAFDIIKGDPRDINIIFDDSAKIANFTDMNLQYDGNDVIEIPMPNDVLPGVYTFFFDMYDGYVGYDSITVTLDVRYGVSVLTQRWNDVIAVKNSVYNGGFDFNAYQWFVNGDTIHGANTSILYSATDLDFNAEYKVCLTRVKDGVSQFTCAFTPQKFDMSNQDLTVYNVRQVHEIETEEPAQVRIWSVLGDLYGVYKVDGSISITMPDKSGIYIMEIITADYRNSYKILVK